MESSNNQQDLNEEQPQNQETRNEEQSQPEEEKAEEKIEENKAEEIKTEEKKPKQERKVDKDCAVCFLIMVEPVQLPCKHVFCRECLRNFFTF